MNAPKSKTKGIGILSEDKDIAKLMMQVIPNQDREKVFASSCTFVAVRKIHIHIASRGNGKRHDGAIQGIFLEFDTPFQPTAGTSEFPVSLENDRSTERILELDHNDAIVGIEVWQTKTSVQAIRFQLKSGLISDLYGVPELLGPTCQVQVRFVKGEYPDSELVGVFGSVGEDEDVLETLGFWFAQTALIRSTPPPSAASLVDHKEEERLDSLVAIASKRDEDKDVVLGWAMVMSIFITGAFVSWMGRRN